MEKLEVKADEYFAVTKWKNVSADAQRASNAERMRSRDLWKKPDESVVAQIFILKICLKMA